MQYEAPSSHLPLRQRREQQSLAIEHGLPAVLQEALSAWHCPPWQLPPQHSVEVVQL